MNESDVYGAKTHKSFMYILTKCKHLYYQYMNYHAVYVLIYDEDIKSGHNKRYCNTIVDYVTE